MTKRDAPKIAGDDEGSPDHYVVFTANGSVHAPRYRFDCENCKFGWNCGPLCFCSVYEEPPRERVIDVLIDRLVGAKQRGRNPDAGELYEYIRTGRDGDE